MNRDSLARDRSSLIDLRAVALLSVGVGALAIVNAVLVVEPGVDDLIFDLLFLGFDTNIPAWYSSVLLAVAAVPALECARISHRSRRRSDRLAFLALAATLLLMSCDEIARFHEVVPTVAARRMGLIERSPFESHQWLLLGGPTVIIVLTGVLAVSHRALRRNRVSLTLAVGGVTLIVIGGVGLEAIIALAENCRGACQRLEIMIEETMEMSGTLLICSSLILWRDAFLDKSPGPPG